MRNTLFLLFILTVNTTFGQNLITNGGFESGTTNWTNWWSRDAKGNATIVNSPVNTGTKALQVVYPGSADWSFTVNKQYLVKTGDLFELSAWVNANTTFSDAQLSVELIDSTETVTNWMYGTCAFANTNGQYKQFSSSFSVPAKVKKIVPRLMGNRSCSFTVDDISMTLLGNLVGSNKTYTLENSNLKTIISYPSMKISTLNKVNNRTYTTVPLYEYLVTSIDTSVPNKLILNTHHLTKKIDLTFEFSLSENALDIKLKGDSMAVLNDNLQFPGAIASSSTDFLVIPRGTGVIWPVNKNYYSSSFVLYDWKSTMSFIGVTDMTSGYMIVSEDPYDTEVLLSKASSLGFINPTTTHASSKGIWGYDRTMHYVFVNDGYLEMCQWYKKFVEAKGYRKTLTHKAIENPNMNRLKGAVDFWVINMNFVQKDADNLYKYGIDRALFSFSSYEYSLPKLIDSLNVKGFLTSKYDIFTDVFPANILPSATGYRREGYPEDVIVKKDGTLQEGWLAYVNGAPLQGYYTCAQTHSNWATKEITTDLATNRYNNRFIDVEMASGLKECYSTAHPVSRKMDALARIAALNIVKNKFSLVTGVEEARDFAFPVSDYGEGTMSILPQVNAGYDWSTPIDTIGAYYGQYNLNPATRVPLHGLVYHDVHIPTWYTGDGVSKVPSLWDDKDLFNILYASMPLFMPPNRTYWNTNFDKFLTSYHLISNITRNVAFEEMTKHSFLSTDRMIQQTEFSNGWKVTVNFDKVTRLVESRQLSAKGFYASDGNQHEVFRISADNSTLAVASIENRLFINPYGIEKTYKGVKTIGTIFLRNDPKGLHLAFIGTQNFIKFKPSEMIWKLGHAYSETTGKTITMSELGDGWVQLNRPANESFVRFDLNEIVLSSNSIRNIEETLDCFPNPASDQVTITFTLKDSMKVKLSLCNMQGQPVKELLYEKANAGLNRYDFNVKGLAKDSYLLIFKTNVKQLTEKIVIQ